MKKFDKELVFLVSENARIKLRELSELLRKSPQRLKYAYLRLEKEAIIYQPYCVFDYSYFGLILFRVYFKGGYIGERDKGAIIRKLVENPYVVSISELSGEYDLAIELCAQNPSRFNKELRQVSEIIPTLNYYKVLVNIVTHIYPRAYLTREPLMPFPPILLGGDREFRSFSEKEMSLIKALLENPKQRTTMLARKCGMNPRTVNGLLNALVKQKVIKGFKYLVDLDKLGIIQYRLFLSLHNVSEERDSELMEFLTSTKEVTQVNRCVGDWAMEVDIEATESPRAKYIIKQLREDFKDIISGFNLIEVVHQHQRSYLPAHVFL